MGETLLPDKLMTLVLTFFGSLLLSLALCWPVQKFLQKKGLWDKPNDRSSHKVDTLRGGGLGPLTISVCGILIFVIPENLELGLAWLGGVSVLSWISFRDDCQEVSIGSRLAAQVISVMPILWVLEFEEAPVITLILLGFILVAYINFVNFMDGINGLVVGLMILIPAGVLFVAPGVIPPIKYMACVLGGAAGGFLPFNFPKAKMFLGDVGSITLGFNSAVILLWIVSSGSGKSDSWLVALIPMYFFAEGVWVILRRMIKGEKWWHPHREHFYQRLVRVGFSHTKVSVLLWGGQILMTVTLWVSLESSWGFAKTCLLCISIWMLIFIYAEFTFRKHVRAPASSVQ